MADAAFKFLPLGAILQSFTVAGVNIVQGFPTQDLYASHNEAHFGATIGRVANRISQATIKNINGGKSYPLEANNGPNNLHGGSKGWGKQIWEGPKPVGTRKIPGVDSLQGGESVEFKIVSKDGDGGFPGTVEATCTYTSGTQTVDGKEVTVLGIEYEAKLVGDAVDETVINMTNHTYFNLTGGPSIAGTHVTLASDRFLPVDDWNTPTGGIDTFTRQANVTSSFELGAKEPVIDDCFIVNEDVKSIKMDTRSSPLTKLVSASSPESGIHLEVLSTEPAFQYYTGTWIDIPALGGYPARAARSGFCVEPSRYVDAANRPEWRDQMVLKKGDVYGARIVYKAWKA